MSGEEELGKLGRDFLNSPNYQKAFRFGGEEIREMLEKARKDTVYYDAKRLTLQKDNKNISKTAYKNAISQLERISGWRDTDLLIEMYRGYIVQIEAQEEADRQERKRQIQLAGDRTSARRRQAQKNSKKVRRLAGYAAVCICGTAALLMLLKPMLHDSSTQQTIQTEKSTGTAEADLQIQTEPVAVEMVDPQAERYAAAEALLANGETAKAAIAFGKLAGYSDAQERSFGLWNSLIKRDSIYCINGCFYGLKNDGSVVTAGADEFGIAGNPVWQDIVQFTGTGYFQEDSCILGLRSDGRVVTAGQNEAGQCDVSGWTNIVKLWHNGYRFYQTSRDAAGFQHNTYLNYVGMTIGLRADGTVVTAGSLEDVFDVSGWTDIVDLELVPLSNWQERKLEEGYLIGIRSDGTVVFTGNPTGDWMSEAASWTDIVDVAANGFMITGLRSDGTIVVVSRGGVENESLKDWVNVTALVSTTSALTKEGKLRFAGDESITWQSYPRGMVMTMWDNLVAVTDGGGIGLKADGTVVVAAAFSDSPHSKVQGWTDVVAVCGSTGDFHGYTIGVRKDGTVLAAGDTQYLNEVATWTDIKIPNS